MVKRLYNIFGKSKASIGQNSNHNTIVQNSEINNPIICSNNVEVIRTLGNIKAYDVIQQQMQDLMSVVKKSHPLYPVFSAKYNNQLDSLVSTPETADAFKRYPKKIKGSIRMDYSKYPKMDRAETPWEYAYRTQTTVELETTAYQEYLGDMEDPFPVTRYVDGMTMIIGAPEFPPAVHAIISSGDVSIPCEIRRLPCIEYGQICFGTVAGECGLNIRIISYNDLQKMDINLQKEHGIDIRQQLQREKLLDAMRLSKQFSIAIGDSPSLNVQLSDANLSSDMLRSARHLIQYYESLLRIEETLHCTFASVDGEISCDDYKTALILAASLDEKWYRVKIDYDNEIRLDCDHIPNDMLDVNFDISEFTIEAKVTNIELRGIKFSADKYIRIYQGARINNLDSVIRNKKKGRKDILVTFKPKEGANYFYKLCRLDGIRVADDG